MLASPTAHDRRLALRAASVASLASLISLVVIAATDEGAPWPQRLGMASALAPVTGTLGALVTLRLAAARGELRALAAVGVDPARAVLGAILGGTAVGLVGPALAALRLADLQGLFPRPALARLWLPDGDGLREASLGLRVGPHGALGLDPPARAVAAALPPATASLAILTLVAAALVCPAWVAAAESRSLPRRAVVGGAAILLAIAAFQAVAAARAPAAVLLAAPALLLIDAARARYLAAERGGT